MSMLSTTNYRYFCLILATFFTLALNSSTSAQTVLRVDGDGGQANGDGITWSTAYKYLADAIAFAKLNNGAEDLWVAAGTYVPDQDAANPGGTGNPDATFRLDFNNITILGGFVGGVNGETDPLQRNPELNITVLDGLLGTTAEEVCGEPNAGSCTADNGTPGCDDEACCNTVCSVDPSCCQFVWDSACATFALDVCGVCGDPEAGDCYVATGSPGCDNADCCAAVCEDFPLCCTSEWDGLCATLADGICADLPDPPALPRSYHVVTADGVNSTVRLDGFTITGGFATGANPLDDLGGGMLILDASPAVVRCIFTYNSAPGHGGGAIAIKDSGHPFVVNCQFLDNIAAEGGAIHSEGGTAGATFLNCLFARNTASGDKHDHGGAIDHGDSTDDVVLINCTLTENSADAEGGAIFLHLGGEATVINSILWGNLAGGLPNEIKVEGNLNSLATVTFSDIEGGWGVQADMNIDDDPLFINPIGGDYRLMFGSPCIDWGDLNDSVIPDDTYDVNQDGVTVDQPTPDLDLLDRIVNGIVDMGGYEYPDLPCPADLDGNGTVGTTDLLILLAAWGTAGPGDIDGDGVVATADLLILLAAWGPCSGSGLPDPLSIEEEMINACLTMDNWNEYYNVMTGPSSQTRKDRYQCWMTHYINDCNKCLCIGQSGCPAPDPFN